MIFNRFIRNIKEGCKNLGRNKLFTFASITTMTLCIFLIGLFFAIGFNILVTVKNIETNVPITVFFENNITKEQQIEIENTIKESDKVKETKYIGPEEAWDRYKKIYFKDRPELAEGFKNDNPLINSASIEIYLKSVDSQESFVKKLENIPGIRKVNHSSDAASKIITFNTAFTYVGIVVIIVLLFIAVFLISNTVAIGISVRQEEIQIMQYVGARDKFIRGPFVTEGIVIGLIGVIIPLILEYFLYSKAIMYFSKHFSLLSKADTFVSVNEIFKYFIPIAIFIGVFIGLVASRITIRRYLNK